MYLGVVHSEEQSIRKPHAKNIRARFGGPISGFLSITIASGTALIKLFYVEMGVGLGLHSYPLHPPSIQNSKKINLGLFEKKLVFSDFSKN